ncbi:hypothetical protein KIN20_026515 [Parelaphostrongylus tenuis]|uniref:Uncharacterized protein n=1 Tax=Parelaphostrongylus tenuis TaxID=148309 RepID=A0AAD5WCV8_PARTN|nr:hypothetical protein KIN20_006217 [Parelaphostrongylus tenuis]KAJ1366005.1 hypothetical protein KIN20_026515 [Parelaphostrongylus tenuis]
MVGLGNVEVIQGGETGQGNSDDEEIRNEVVITMENKVLVTYARGVCTSIVLSLVNRPRDE